MIMQTIDQALTTLISNPPLPGQHLTHLPWSPWRTETQVEYLQAENQIGTHSNQTIETWLATS